MLADTRTRRMSGTMVGVVRFRRKPKDERRVDPDDRAPETGLRY